MLFDYINKVSKHFIYIGVHLFLSQNQINFRIYFSASWLFAYFFAKKKVRGLSYPQKTFCPLCPLEV